LGKIGAHLVANEAGKGSRVILMECERDALMRESE
jgi:hypothetical protein